MLLPAVRVGAVAAMLFGRSLLAQSGSSGVTVRGLAYDSLRHAPLAGARVSVVGTTRSTTTDDHGRFQLDGVPPGRQTFAAEHAALDSVGFSGISARADVTDGREEIRLAVPSFATLWAATCGGATPPKDTGFVYGTVRHVGSGEPLANGTVDVTWYDLSVLKLETSPGQVSRSWWRGRGTTDSQGNYVVCGIPSDIGVRARAIGDSGSTGLIDLPVWPLLVQRRDFTVGRTIDSATTARGSIAGSVMDSSGRAVADARVISDELGEIRTDSAGKFAIRGIPAGTRQIEISAIGMTPSAITVDVMPNEVSTVSATLRRITMLDVVRVTGSKRAKWRAAEFEERKMLGTGYMRDSSQIGVAGTLSSVFYQFPGLTVEREGSRFWLTLQSNGRGRCVPNLWVDAALERDFEYLNFLRPADIAAIEVYPRVFNAPARYQNRPDCGVVMVWTKWGFQ